MGPRLVRHQLGLLLVAGLALHAPQAVAAQVVGLPVHFSPTAQPGLRLFSDFAFGDKPVRTYWGGRALLNLSYVSLGLAAGERSDADFGWGTNLALNIFRGPSRKFALSLEANYGEGAVDAGAGDIDIQEIPIGVGLALETAQPGLDLEPWLGVRAHVRRSRLPSLAPETNVGLGISAGVNLRTAVLTKVGIPLPGFGLHLAADYLAIPRPYAEGTARSLIVNLGVNYLFEIGGLPPYGIIGTCDPTAPDPC
jgi:hypothetical protein